MMIPVSKLVDQVPGQMLTGAGKIIIFNGLPTMDLGTTTGTNIKL